MTLLVVKDLEAGYGNLKVLRRLTFEVQPGQIAVILGANGAGKTTTLRALCGMTWRRGTVILEGRDLSRLSTERIATAGVAHVPQGRGTFVDFTVEENLRLGAYVRNEAAAVEQDMDRWMSFFPRLRERREQMAGSLSGGEQQMLAIARALMSRPQLLLLDEPSLGLAPMMTQELFRMLASINAELGLAMLLVEQNANLALDLADHAFVLESGVVVLRGEAAQIQADESVRRIYLGYT